MSNHPRSIFGPLFLIAAGVIWLLVELGNIPVSNLWALTHIWPFFLIAAGIGLILRPFWKYSSMIMDIMIVGGAVFSIVFAPQLGWDNPTMTFMVDGSNIYAGPSQPGSGNVVTETRKVSSFDSIKVDYPAQVTVSQGKTESIKIEAEDNLLPGLRTDVKNGQLRIYYHVDAGKPVNATEPIRVAIVVKDLKDIEFDSAGELTVKGLNTDSLDLSLSGAGSLKLDDVVLTKFSVNLSGAGSIFASGSTDNLDLNISGFGSFNGKDLEAQFATANLSGAGSATVWVDKELIANISGVGSVNYYGSASVKKTANGIGGVNSLGNK
jgi:hypothetical protein